MIHFFLVIFLFVNYQVVVIDIDRDVIEVLVLLNALNLFWKANNPSFFLTPVLKIVEMCDYESVQAPKLNIHLKKTNKRKPATVELLLSESCIYYNTSTICIRLQ